MAEFSWVADPASGIRQRFVEANDQRFELAEAGDSQSGKLAILLHGFPELNFSWRHKMPELAAQGWRVWAPNLRGYGKSTKPEGVPAYRMDHLLADAAALIGGDTVTGVTWAGVARNVRFLTPEISRLRG